MAVFVLDRIGKPLMPCSEKRARKLLAAGRARIHRLYPFAIRIIDRRAADSHFQSLQLSIDPGSKVTGFAVNCITATSAEGERNVVVLNLFQLMHRGRQISEALKARAALRRGRRSRKTRYRAPRFLNRRKPQGWLAPSLRHRVETTAAWVKRFMRLAPLAGIHQELVRFDMQKMENPEVSGIEYQRGTLHGFEVREYVLAKCSHACVYCDKKDVPLNLDHVQAKSNQGSNRVSNLVAACIACNQKKGNRDIREFVRDPRRLARILAQLKAPLRDAAAVNATRWALFCTLKATGLPVQVASGGRTKFNRVTHGIPKTHALDAACVGPIKSIANWNRPTWLLKATGRGAYQRTRVNASGRPIGYLTRDKRVHGFQTGDMVLACVPSGKKQGIHLGRVAVRKTGSFNIQKANEVVQGISHKHCKVIQRADGYGYSLLQKQTIGKLPDFLPQPDASALPVCSQANGCN